MRNLIRRIAELEQRTGAGLYRVMVTYTGPDFALDLETCGDLLAEFGYTRPGAVSVVMDFCNVPLGLTPAELERYLREHGAEICTNVKPGSRGLPLLDEANV